MTGDEGFLNMACLGGAECAIKLRAQWTTAAIERHPALYNVMIRESQGSLKINPNENMIRAARAGIAHNGIGRQLNAVDMADFGQQIVKPLPSVIELRPL
jgi:hypothetical protein